MTRNSEVSRFVAEAKRMVAPKLGTMLQSDADWLRNACIGRDYWNLYFFNKVLLGMVDLCPKVHLLYCEFLDDPRNNYKLAMMPRDFVKSWILRGKAIRDYLIDNDIRILIAMATEDLARNASEQMASIMTRNQLLRFLFPDNVPQVGNDDRWTSKSRTLPRTLDAPEPTWSYAGVKTELVSGHYDKIFLDDIFAKEAADSAEVASKVFSFHASCQPLMNDPKTSEIIQVCTRWAMDDLAAKIMGADKQHTEQRVFRAEGDTRYVCLKRSAIEDGKAIWDRFDLDTLGKIEKGYEAQGMGHFFAFQHLNNPMDARVVEFATPRYWERVGEHDLELDTYGGKVRIDERDLYRTMTVDAAYTGKGDEAAIVVIGSHPKGYRINLFTYLARVPLDVFVEEILKVLKASFSRGLPIAKFGMETNATQLATKNYIQERARQAKVYVPWAPIRVGPEQSKQSRIRQMVPLVNEGLYFSHRRWVKANMEMKMFPASKKDNFLDALAHQPQIWGIASREEIVAEEPGLWHDLAQEEEYEHRIQRVAGYGG